VEFTMLDPHVRLTLGHDGRGAYGGRFKVPDVYGVFKYVLEYRRPGYSTISLTQQVPVRPFHHDEYPRFLTAAAPYYAAATSTAAAFFAMSLFFLYHK
jgi:oligosaccharyltransferase complex subunit beta